MKWELSEPDQPAGCPAARMDEDALEWAHRTAGQMLTVVMDGKAEANGHTEWGALHEVHQLAQRILNVTTMALSGRPSGVGL